MQELLTDNFTVNELIKGNFEQVHRVKGNSLIYNLEIILDIHSGLFPMDKDLNYSFSILQDKHKMEQYYQNRRANQRKEFKDWEYITFGTIFEIRNKSEEIR